MIRRRAWYRNFLDDLRTLIRAGVPVREALESMSSEGGGPGGRLARRALEEVQKGATLAEALATAGAPREHVAVVDAGEHAGALDAVLGKLVGRTDEERRIVSELRQSAAYPALLCVAAVVLLPMYLLVTGDVGSYIGIQLLFFVPLALIAALILRTEALLPPGSRRRELLERALTGIPGIRNLVLDSARGRALSLVGLLLETGGSLDAALDLAAAAAPLHELRAGLRSAGDALRSGMSLGAALAGLSLRPAAMARIRAGEASGTVERTLGELGEEMEARVLARVRSATKVLPPLLILTVGAVVLVRALRVLGGVGGAF